MEDLYGKLEDEEEYFNNSNNNNNTSNAASSSNTGSGTTMGIDNTYPTTTINTLSSVPSTDITNIYGHKTTIEGSTSSVDSMRDILLRTNFGNGKRTIFIVTYHLPVVLRKRRSKDNNSTNSEWTAQWIEDDILARTPNSIAGDVKTIWIGVVTRECIDNTTWEEDLRGAAPGSLSSTTSKGPNPSDYSMSTNENDETKSTNPPSVIKTLTYAAPVGNRVVVIRSDETKNEQESQGPTVAIRGMGCESSTVPNTPTSDAVPSISSTTASTNRDASSMNSQQFNYSGTVTFQREDMIAIAKTLNSMDVIPIFLPTGLHEDYAGYCLGVLRPALCNVLETGSQHMFPQASSLALQNAGWEAYEEANEAVARVVLSQYGQGDVVWTHDYQLCLVPKHISQWVGDLYGGRSPQVFFMHSAFPTSEIFRTLAVRDQLIEAMLECDVVGFHTFNYARHFLHACKRLLGISFRSRRGGSLALDYDGRDVLVNISHVGVEAAALDRWMASESAAKVACMFAEKYPGKLIIAGIDTCQRMSGMALKLLAFERLLEDYPVYRGNVILVQRCELRHALISDVQKTSAELRGRVAQINATYGPVVDYEEAPSYSPMYRVGLFHQADVFLQTTIREGLNLLPLEYVYVRTKWQMIRSRALAVGGNEGPILGDIHANNSPVSVPPTVPSGVVSPPNSKITTLDQRSIPTPSNPLTNLVRFDSDGSTNSAPTIISSIQMENNQRSLDSKQASILATTSIGSSIESSIPVFSDATLKAMSTGMPAYYATISAPPSASRNRQNRASVMSIFNSNSIPNDSSTNDASTRSNVATASPGTRTESVTTTTAVTVSTSTITASDRPSLIAVSSGTPGPASVNPSGLTNISIARSSSQSSTTGLRAVVSGTTATPRLEGGSTTNALNSFANPMPLPFEVQRYDPATLQAPLPPPFRGGCVILSEFAAATSVLNSNLVVNPWNIRATVKEIDKALLMADHERSFRQWRDYLYAISKPAALWSRSIISDIVEVRSDLQQPVQGTNANASFSSPLYTALTPTSSFGASPSTIISRSSTDIERSPVPLLDILETVRAFRASKKRLIVLDYGGTLVNRVADKQLRQPFLDGYVQSLPTEVLTALAALARIPGTILYIISGLRASTIDALQLSRIASIGLAAENCMFVSHPTSVLSSSSSSTIVPSPSIVSNELSSSSTSQEFANSTSINDSTPVGTESPMIITPQRPIDGVQPIPAVGSIHTQHRTWTGLNPPDAETLAIWAEIKKRTTALMTDYAWRVNGSVVREYESIIAWDFRNADPEWAQSQAKFVANDVEALAEECNGTSVIKVTIRRSRVEVSLRSMNKGNLINDALSRMKDIDFILCVGDDTSDEDMFAAVSEWNGNRAKAGAPPATTFTATVGKKTATNARFWCVDVPMIQQLVVGLYQEGIPGSSLLKKL